MKHYVSSGINWIFVYGVLYEDDCIVILKDLGRFHRYDEDREFTGQIDDWVDFIGECIMIDGSLKLVEIQ